MCLRETYDIGGHSRMRSLERSKIWKSRRGTHRQSRIHRCWSRQLQWSFLLGAQRSVPVPAVLLLDRQMEVISLATLTEVSLPYLLDVRKEKTWTCAVELGLVICKFDRRVPRLYKLK